MTPTRCGLEHFPRPLRTTVGFYPRIAVNPLARKPPPANPSSWQLERVLILACPKSLKSSDSFPNTQFRVIGKRSRRNNLTIAQQSPCSPVSRGEPKPDSKVWQSVDLGQTSDAERQQCCNNRNHHGMGGPPKPRPNGFNNQAIFSVYAAGPPGFFRAVTGNGGSAAFCVDFCRKAGVECA